MVSYLVLDVPQGRVASSAGGYTDSSTAMLCVNNRGGDEANETRKCSERARVGRMDSDYGVPRELSDLQKQRALYEPELPPCLQVPLPPSYVFCLSL